jgi:transcriptional regulator with XRE-family HTH domain
MKAQEKFKAVALRKKGLSYKKILERIDVSRSTLSLWLRDIQLSPAQLKKILIGREKFRYTAAQSKKLDRIKRTNEIIFAAKKEVKHLIKSPLFLTGLALYWAEGAKNPMESVKFVNSDEVIRSYNEMV